jgi:hypothetical protein
MVSVTNNPMGNHLAILSLNISSKLISAIPSSTTNDIDKSSLATQLKIWNHEEIETKIRASLFVQ